MTNKYNNWERLQRVIDYSKMSANAFALYIGMARAENIYHIKRGNFGISEDLAKRIVARFPNINPTWLLTGVGSMFRNVVGENTKVPFYEGELCDIICDIEGVAPRGFYNLPYSCDCDMVVRTMVRGMMNPGTAAADLFLKHAAVDDIVQGNEYIVVLADDVVWRKIRIVRGSAEELRLVAYDREAYPDMFVRKEDIREVWRVLMSVNILVS